MKNAKLSQKCVFIFITYVSLFNSLEINNNVKNINGLLCYHHYSDYENLDSELFLFNFTDNTLKSISSNFNLTIKHSMNGHINPKTGNSLVFMGINIEYDRWAIYYIENLKKFIQKPYIPTLLTDFGLSFRDEDPKWDFKGEKIVIKRNFRSIVEINISTKESNILFSDLESEFSMPFYNKNGSKIIYCEGPGKNGLIGIYDIENNSRKTLYDRENVFDYYPITYINSMNGEEKIFFSSWKNEYNRHDQIYLGDYDGNEAVLLAFNGDEFDSSDSCQVDNEWIIISSTREGNTYDLYLANIKSGEVINLNEINEGINTEDKHELGASFWMEL